MSDHRKYDFRNLHYVGQDGRLIPELQRAQEEDGYITPEKIREIHERYGIPLSHIFGVATFYSQFRLEPVGKNIVRVCQGTACHVAGAKEITRSLEEILEVKTGGTTPDRLFTLETVSCLGCCSLAPVIMINDDTYGNLKPGDLKKIIKERRKREAAEVGTR